VTRVRAIGFIYTALTPAVDQLNRAPHPAAPVSNY
jgi:hypothetical protein